MKGYLMNIKKSIFPLAAISAGILAIIAMAIIINIANQNEIKRIEFLNYRADSVYAVGCKLIESNQIDSAYSILNETVNMGEKGWKPRSADSASNLMREIETFRGRQKVESVRSFFVAMSDYDYDLLKKISLKKQYFNNAKLNEEYMRILYDNRNNRQRFIAEEKALLAKAERERKRQEYLRAIEEKKQKQEIEKAASIFRKEYAKTLRNEFLDLGFDINVQVAGENNTRLILTFVLFNEVWMRKFETSGNFDAWHKLGFNRVDLKDGYNYHRYMYWK